jgi:ligand-binding sensor domain-containing protein
MYRRLLFILLASLFVCVCSTAQSVDQSGFTRYTRMDGLSNNSVSGIVQDPLGYIWIATNKGLNRFDSSPATIPSLQVINCPTIWSGR